MKGTALITVLGRALAIWGGIALFAAAGPATAAPAWGVPVLMYHMVDPHVPSDPVGRDLTLRPSSLRAELAYLNAHHIQTLTASQLVQALQRGERPRAAVLTFDDGYADAATVALPILEQYHAKGTFFISAGLVGTPRHVTWAELREMRAAGMEIGCHGMYHHDLALMSASTQAAVVRDCLTRIARYAGVRPTTYAYPAGDYNATTLAVMRRFDLLASFTENPGPVRSLTGRYALPRLRVRRSSTLDGFAALVSPALAARPATISRSP